ncbi:hypothetical protein [Bacterioplanoides sp. SCSIO 12839]|uniref:hypothetical protein n=1 Tax=Bacterioplanoides sp. SCSIO 12839 TaxID=2829569 RepID=UPI0021024428|nr:hypothetical protein [Bacterioplanoides sp. SCSIO 12839]UTW49653.1 hypothetical protein KFF03_07140 [Bacterioplanoides sp. SCSIO 12839]
MTKSKLLLLGLTSSVALIALITGVNSAKDRVVIEAQPSTAISKAVTSAITTTPAPSNIQTTSQAESNHIHTPDLNTHPAENATYHTDSRQHEHSHNDQDIDIPVEINAYIEAQRIPRHQLKAVKNPNGSYSLDPQGQFETVSIAVIGEDGKVHITERQIQPTADSTQQ